MPGVEVGDFGSPDETRAPDKTTVEIVRMGGTNASRMRLEPGWRWSDCIKPIAGTRRYQVPHVVYAVARRITILPGHDARIEGDEPFIGVRRSFASPQSPAWRLRPSACARARPPGRGTR